MFQSFSSLRNFLNSSRRSTESLVFYLHYRVTFLVLLFCCVLVSTQQFYSHKIQCLSQSSGRINVELLNSYCWAASTYSIHSAYLKEAGIDVPHPGVASSTPDSKHEYRNFYQYVHILLFIQALLFYVPHLLWKGFESKFKTRLGSVISALGPGAGKKDEHDTEAMNAVATYIEDRWGVQKTLALQYLLCEVLSVTNVMLQSYLLNLFFHGRFLALLISDPVELFPLVTICTFRRYGPTGHVDVLDSLCVLPNNAINAKIYLCLWVWFLVLTLLSCVGVLHLLLCICVPVYRIAMTRAWVRLSGRAGLEPLATLLKLGDFGDWFVLQSVRRDLDELEFTNLTENVRERVVYEFTTEPASKESV